MADLNTPVQYIKGVGEARAKALEKLDIRTLSDLVSNFPRAYDDRTVRKTIKELTLGESVCVHAFVATPPKHSYVRKGMELVKFKIADDTGVLDITFFNQAYVKNSFTVGEEFVFYGKISGNLIHYEMINPLFEREEKSGTVTGRIIPIYRLTSGISQNMMMKAVTQGLNECGDVLPDPLPQSVRLCHNLAASRFAYENIHFPQNYEALAAARNRLVFEELFVLSCAMTRMRKTRERKSGLKFPDINIDDFYASLSFELTGAQKRAINDALSDMKSGSPMNRLIQGDVGSGKTMVAAASCVFAAKAGYQSAFMAPTEILAEQHYKTLSPLFEKLGIKTELLTGGLTAKAKREVKEKIALGMADVVIGTHALITDDTKFKNLGLVVADEQHRFGVQQRAALSEKGTYPHVLVMSATPIPRTLALIIYGELDVSIIDELPPGRQKIDTYSVGEKMRQRIYNFIRKHVSEGRQCYIVCPMVEENEDGTPDLKSVKEYAKHISENVFPDLKTDFIHGKMKSKEKDKVMTAFAKGETDILVSTTVIEVGVDVPNAVLMVIENADRFGLSQLHQLRGRVGRGQHKSYCILFEGAGGAVSSERLKVLCDTNDGFKISEEDLRLRGPGDFFGNRQHGLPELKIAGFTSDMDILREAQDAAERVIADDPELEKPDNLRLKQHIEKMFREKEDTFN